MHSHEDLLTAFSLSAVLRLRRRFQALAELYRQQRGNTSCGAANRRSEKNAFSEAASIFPLRLPLRGLKGASSPFLVDPARRNRWCFSGSLLARKRELSSPQKQFINIKRPSSSLHENLKVFLFSFLPFTASPRVLRCAKTALPADRCLSSAPYPTKSL